MQAHHIAEPELRRFLDRHGFLSGASLEIGSAISRYQQFHGLDVDGWCGPATARSMLAPRMCSHPDIMPAPTSGRPHWAGLNISWGLDRSLPFPSGVDVVSAFEWAWDQWALACCIKPITLPSGPLPNCLAVFRSLPGGGMVGYSQIPAVGQPMDSTLEQTFEINEAWSTADPAPAWHVDLNRVVAHEVGHILGLPHLPAGNLMAPIYNPAIRTPQAGDIAEIVTRYGKPPASALKTAMAKREEVFLDLTIFDKRYVGKVVEFSP